MLLPGRSRSASAKKKKGRQARARGRARRFEDAGYEIDYVSGSSIGAVVGVCLGLGMDSTEIQATMIRLFTPENVKELFTLSFAGTSTGGDTMKAMLGTQLRASFVVPTSTRRAPVRRTISGIRTPPPISTSSPRDTATPCFPARPTASATAAL